MPKTKYCNFCGTPSEISSNFCGNCGNSLIPGAQIKVIAAAKELEVEITHKPVDIESLENRVEIEVKRNKITIGDIATGSKGETLHRPKPAKMTKKQILADFKREAGSLRNT